MSGIILPTRKASGFEAMMEAWRYGPASVSASVILSARARCAPTPQARASSGRARAAMRTSMVIRIAKAICHAFGYGDPSGLGHAYVRGVHHVMYVVHVAEDEKPVVVSLELVKGALQRLVASRDHDDLRWNISTGGGYLAQSAEAGASSAGQHSEGMW